MRALLQIICDLLGHPAGGKYITSPDDPSVDDPYFYPQFVCRTCGTPLNPSSGG